ncbi:MAG TPA: hypothetical protein DIW24_04785, partial [Bacteroidetes bacterium]|nr:hypothetical protein [Bacteroidota bacterium]
MSEQTVSNALNASAKRKTFGHFWPIHYYYASSEAITEVQVHEPTSTRIPELLVQRIWRDLQFQHVHARTTEGAALAIMSPGRHNTETSGPDFFAASLKMGEEQWAGDVEIHVRSGDWLTHGHERDPAYDRVILHVSLFEDEWTGKVRRRDGSLIPELILLPLLEPGFKNLLYQHFIQKEHTFLCQPQWHHIPATYIRQHLPAYSAERLSTKSQKTAPHLQALFVHILEGLGYTQNRIPMQLLANRVEVEWLYGLPVAEDREALLLGAAGLLPRPKDLLEADRVTSDYVMDLTSRFERLTVRYGITPLAPQVWRFSGLRPANFPPLRLAQAAALFSPGGLFDGDPVEAVYEASCQRDAILQLR